MIISAATGRAIGLYPVTLSDIGIGEPANSYNIDITLINHGIINPNLVTKSSAEIIISSHDNSCLDDYNQINHNLSQYHSIMTHPPYADQVTRLYPTTLSKLNEQNNTCTVDCNQTHRYGKCTWTHNDWGNTVKFTPV